MIETLISQLHWVQMHEQPMQLKQPERGGDEHVTVHSLKINEIKHVPIKTTVVQVKLIVYITRQLKKTVRT